MSWPALRVRFRLNRMERKGWLWTIGLFLFMLITAGLLSVLLLSIIPGLVEKGVLTIPDSTPSFIDPRIPQGLESMKNQMGAEAVGNWSLLVIAIFSPQYFGRGVSLARLYPSPSGANIWQTYMDSPWCSLDAASCI